MFAVRSPDPMFGLYTAALNPLLGLPGQSPQTGNILAPGDELDPVFDMSTAQLDPVDGAWIMRGAAPAGPSSPAGGPPAAPGRDLRWGFQVLIPLTGDPTELGRLYRIVLDSRAAPWKYILTGEWSSDQPRVQEVVSPASATTSPPASSPDTAIFVRVTPDETTADGHPAIAFRSIGPIPLRDRPARRFELWSQASDRPLITALPTANPANLALERPADPSTVVCEIFVSR
jgi:hypothetical protein